MEGIQRRSFIYSNSMMDINCLEKRIAELFGISSYKYIQDTFRNVDVSKDLEFQRIFNGYYVVRRNKEWRDIYYSIFEKVKNAPNQCSFEYVIRDLYEQTGNIEASFTSKMLAISGSLNIGQ